VTIAKSITPVFAPGNKVIPGNGFEIVQNSSQLERYRHIAVIGYRTRAVHHSKSRAHNGGLILAYGVGNGQAVSLGRLREGGRKPSKPQGDCDSNEK
jgi:hypothetical protein